MGRKKSCPSRGRRAAWNFGAALLVLALCLGLYRLPLGLVERVVRAGAVEQGVPGDELTVLWRGKLPCLPMGGEGAPLPWSSTAGTVLLQGGGRLWSGFMAGYEGDIFLSGISRQVEPEGPALMTLLSLEDHVPNRSTGATALLTAVGLPKGTVTGVVTLELAGGEVRTARGGREMDVIHFLVPGEEPWGRERGRLLSRAPYTLTLMDADGGVLAEVRGELPDLGVAP